ncbi:carboxylating nicotinate-nucleotide diphosphorylase [Methanosalsum natronophilum]|uniref:Nicotinate-nucleotide pyrophosphorylase [carboxylating] n=1 Tax=Methanosalsum natronophilum TaxID=768733 RepID=A0A3R7XGU5_9EURY|nr:carboxylating nicotinate-nucleotide diphosphorylase [Methanosalsum natronophilum]MCS3923126.1 nicotinate-nucleotide pyrophosphorylase (carboxylating) [Methanosalsum natronophilum]RQD83063.1 MAG: carboxylating nicotinate-nucleotide diphosphorylase [Methanosalsum natronophilum]
MFINEIERFLAEDIAYQDIPSKLCENRTIETIIFTKQDCVIAGTNETISVLDYFGIDYERKAFDGDHLSKGATIFILKGYASSIFQAERICLNLMAHLSGIATLTNKCVRIAKNISKTTRIASTRKTTPGLRRFEKNAVIAGGGDPHRFGLFDAVMLKDNHIKLLGLEKAITKAKENTSFVQKIEVEVESIEDALKAASLGIDIIMLDNMEPKKIIQVIQKLKLEGFRDNVILEASGLVNISNLEEYVKTGVDVISMGSLIYDARWVDLSLKLCEK